ncbi:hypothetical protein P4O66_000508 [Electrophorus voltai]|uniref:Claudin n=1 Tax=Electrophorus voltai TaxID=2609070 RepID=A0AAD9DYT9_9TELE|nr:hypothetical protein P4O66_000508 [Electrophorus voltai]
MDSALCALELLGVFLSLSAWLFSLATTLMSQWLTLSTDLLPAESYELGLWGTCVVQELGVLECKSYDSLLGLPADIRLARILMCVALGTGLMAVMFTIPGIYVVKSCRSIDTLKSKRNLKMLGGTLCFVAGILGLMPVSHIAHLTVQRFFDKAVPYVVPRWEFGDALFWGWTAAFMHLVAGILLVSSCFCFQVDPFPMPVAIPLQGGQSSPALSPTRRTEYV